MNIKRIAGAINQKAKNYKLDAQLIAQYAEVIQPKLLQLKPEQIRLMSDLLSRRRQPIDMQTMENDRLQIMPKEITSSIEQLLTALK